MTTTVKSAPPPPPQHLADDPDPSAAAQAGAQPPPGSTLPASVTAPPATDSAKPIAATGATPAPQPTPQGSAPPGAEPTPPPLPGAPATAAPAPPANNAPVEIKTTEQDTPSLPNPIAPLANAQTRYSAAAAKVEELDKALDKQLAGLDKVFKDGNQRSGYIKAFHDKYKAEYDEKTNAASELGKAVVDPKNDFLAASDPAAAGQVAAAVKTLATTSAHDVAADWMASKFGDGAAPGAGTPYRPFFSNDTISETEKDITLSEAGGGADVYKSIANYQRFANGGIGGTALAGLMKPAQALLQNVAHIGEHNAGDGHPAGSAQVPATSLASPQPSADGSVKHAKPGSFEAGLLDDFKGSYEKVGPKFEAAAYLFSAALISKQPDSKEVGGNADFLGQLALAGQGTTTAETKAFQKFASQALVDRVDALGGVLPALDFASRALGGLAGAAFGVSDIQKAVAENGNPGRVVAAIGDLGSAAALLIGGLDPLVYVGLGVAAVGNQIGDSIEAGKVSDEEAGLLGTVINNPAVADTIARHPNALKSIGSIADVSGDQIQWLAATHPEVFQTDDTADAFAQAANAAGLKGADLQGFAAALATDPGGAMQLAQDLRGGAEGKPYSPAWIVDHVANHGEFPGASAFLGQHAPKAVAESQARSEADIQFDQVLGDPMQTGSAFSAGLAHQDSPVYRAQFIKDAADKGLLANSVSMRSGADTPPAEKANLVHALRDAANDGAISSQDANRYIAQLG